MSAVRQDDGSFSIEVVELHRVYPPTLPPTVHREQYETPKETEVNTNEIIELRIKLEAANKRIEDLEEDREEWRKQASRLLSHTPQPSLWQRLFGKR